MPSTDFMERVQKDINASMRAVLVDWLVEVSCCYILHFLDLLYTKVLNITTSQIKILVGHIPESFTIAVVKVSSLQIISLFFCSDEFLVCCVFDARSLKSID